VPTKAGLPGWFPGDFSTDPELLSAFEDAARWHAAGKPARPPVRYTWQPGDIKIEDGAPHPAGASLTTVISAQVRAIGLAGAEGYIHGFICVRPPCGPKPEAVTAASLSVRSDGTVVHKPSGWGIGQVARSAGGAWQAGHSTDGSATVHGAKVDAVRAVARKYNQAARSGTAVTPSVKPAKTITAQIAETQADRDRIADGIREQASLAAALARHKIETARQLKQMSDEHAAGMLQVQSAIKSATEDLAASIEADEAKISRHRLAWHVGLLAAGAALAAVTLGAGAPIAVTAVAGLAPGVIQELIDFFKGM